MMMRVVRCRAMILTTIGAMTATTVATTCRIITSFRMELSHMELSGASQKAKARDTTMKIKMLIQCAGEEEEDNQQLPASIPDSNLLKLHLPMSDNAGEQRDNLSHSPLHKNQSSQSLSRSTVDVQREILASTKLTSMIQPRRSLSLTSLTHQSSHRLTSKPLSHKLCSLTIDMDHPLVLVAERPKSRRNRKRSNLSSKRDLIQLPSPRRTRSRSQLLLRDSRDARGVPEEVSATRIADTAPALRTITSQSSSSPMPRVANHRSREESSPTSHAPSSLRRQTEAARSLSPSGGAMASDSDATTARCARTSGTLSAHQASSSPTVTFALQCAQTARSTTMACVSDPDSTSWKSADQRSS